MNSASSRSRSSLIEILAYLVNNVTHYDNLTSTNLMLLICGVTLGTLIPDVPTTQLGPAIIRFFTEIDSKLYNDLVKELRARLEENKPLAQVDVDTWLEKIHQTGLESKLHATAFQLELRNLLTRFNLLPNLVLQPHLGS